MVARAEDEELLLLVVPVAAQAREGAGPVVEAVGQEADARLGIGDDTAAEEGVTGGGGGRGRHRCLLGGTDPLAVH